MQIFDTTTDVNINGADSSSLYISWDKSPKNELRNMELYRLKTFSSLYYTLIYTDISHNYYLLTISKDFNLINFITLFESEPTIYEVDNKNSCKTMFDSYIKTEIMKDFSLTQKQGTYITDCKTNKVTNKVKSTKEFMINDDGIFKVTKSNP